MDGHTEITVLDAGQVQQVHPEQDQNRLLIVGLSWVAYLRLIPIMFIEGVLITVAVFAGKYLHQPLTWIVVALVALLWFLYQVSVIRSTKLVINSVGVWLTSGVFPWQKRSCGMQWRDIGIAGYSNGFMSWALRSYRIEIENRFSRNIELTIENLRHGNLVIEQINLALAQMGASR